MTQGGLQDLANQNALKIVAKVGYYCLFQGPHPIGHGLSKRLLQSPDVSSARPLH